MTNYNPGGYGAPQGSGLVWVVTIAGALLLALAVFLALQPVVAVADMAPLVWWGIVGFLGLLGAMLLIGGAVLLRSLAQARAALREQATAFADSTESSYQGAGMSLRNFDDNVTDDAPPIGVASLQPLPFASIDPEDEPPGQFTDSQLSADRGFRTSDVENAGSLAPGATLLPAHEPAATQPSGNFAGPESTTASQFGSLPTAPAAFVSRDTGASFGQTPEPDAARDFWLPALRHITLDRYTALIDRLFTQAGFVTQPQALSTPGMSAIWLFSRSQLGSPVSLVLCEHGSGEGEGVSAHRLQELRDVMTAHGIRRGQFATTAFVGPDMLALASQTGINVLDPSRLLDTISKRKGDQQGELWTLATQS